MTEPKPLVDELRTWLVENPFERLRGVLLRVRTHPASDIDGYLAGE